MNFFKSRFPALILLSAVVVMFLGSLATGWIFNTRVHIYTTPSSFLRGEYSIDDGPWKEVDLTQPIDEPFRKIVFRGSPITDGYYMDEVNVSYKNVWFDFTTSDGELIYSNTFRIRGSEAWNIWTADDEQGTLDFYKRLMPLAMHMPHTPGFESIIINPEIDLKEFNTDEFVLTFENPYHSQQLFSDCVSFTASEGNGAYLRSVWETLLSSVLFLMLCFLGLFLFPVISFVFGKINFRYLSFGFLCFFWSTFRIIRLQSWFLNCIITDPVICMTIERLTVMFFFSSLIVYFRANLNQDISRFVSGLAACGYLLIVAVALILHFTCVRDLFATTPWLHIVMAIILLGLVLLLTREARTDKNSLRHLLSWTPMALTMLLDILRQFIPFGKRSYFIFGFGLTLALQVVQLVFDLQRQYRAALHYEQVQRELYEARVSIMTSQIQPHFMYNALTSIAMMCTIDPPVAQEATVTFAKYLRENMDSLKQNKPVPFEQELDHLKKYLYIEKLRFQNKLNIEYDIAVTDFVLPLLSVQPLVENAVKHGVGMKKKGGTVKIATRETENAYAVIVSDDGVGFDPAAPRADDGRSHVGMDNTRTRLKEMCGGKIVIESKVGEGTIATVILPKEGQKNENTMS